jgi:hypothetical protein
MRNPLITAALACILLGQPLAPALAQVPQIIAPSNSDAQWSPTPAQKELIPTRTRAYFASRDGGRLEDAYAFFSPGQKATVPFADWRSSIEAFNTRAGAVKDRTLQLVTWYKDPPRASPGVYAAVDFVSDFSQLALHCGYVVWQEQPDGSFALVREEDNVVDKETESRLQPGQLEQLRTQYRC